MKKHESLDALFNAQNIAVVGASNNPRKATHQVMRTMLDARYTGSLYPVNPQQDQVLGLKCYPSLLAIPLPVDLLVIGVPAGQVMGVLQEAAQRGDVRGAVILSAGFSETAIPEDVQIEEDIIRLSLNAGIRVVGPNCIGLVNSTNGLCTGFAPGLKIKPGGISLITQSGALGGSFLMLLGDQPEVLGFNKFAHVGNMADVNSIELLDYYAGDETTSVIAMYLEGVTQGRAMMAAARKASSRKPVFVLKVGRTDIGSYATLSHTGTLAGTDRVYDAAFRQSGMVRVQTIEELADACKAAAMLPLPRGSRICVLTEAGGPGIIAMDEIGTGDTLRLAALTPHTCQKIKAILPPMAMVCKPNGYIDMTAAAMEREHAEALKLVLEDPGVDMVIVVSIPPTFLPAIDVAEQIAGVIQAYNKPVAVCMMRGEAMLEARTYLEQRSIPTFDTPERAVKALTHLHRSTTNIRLAEHTPLFEQGAVL